MAVHEDNSIYVPKPSFFTRLVRERGTRRLIIGAAGLCVLWYGYTAVHTNMMNSIKWPALKATKIGDKIPGLYVLGLQDKDRAGFKHRLEARESNHSWQIRYREDDDGPSDSPDSQVESKKGESPEALDRGSSNPGATHRGNSGAVAPIEDIIDLCPVAMKGQNFTNAWIEDKIESLFNRPYWAVHLDLNEEGRSRYWQFSKEHDQERLVFLLDGEILTCPKMDYMYVSDLTIEPIWVKSDAEKLVNSINKK